MPHSHTLGTGLRTYAVVGALGVGSLTAGVAVATIGSNSAPATAPVTTPAEPPAAAPTAPAPVTVPAAPANVTQAPMPDVGSVPPATAPPTPAPDGGPSDEVDETVDGPEGVSEPGPVDPDWTNDDHEPGADVPLEPVDPCDQLTAEQQFIAPSVVTLPSGATAGELAVTNCSDGPLPVEFDAANGLDFAVDATDLPPGTSAHVFTIDTSSVDVGAFELKFKVTQTGCCADYGDVFGFKQGFDPDLALDLDLTAGPGQGGCKAGCITSAWIEGNLLNTSVDLHVTTKVAADISAYVSTQAPVANQDGDPWMPGVPPAVSASDTTSLDGVITGLEDGTTYHIVIRAVDENGVSTYADSFHTVTPVDHPSDIQGNDPTPGCSTGCITHAVVQSAAHDRAHLTVHTSMPTTIETWIGTSAPTESGGAPAIPDAIAHHQTPDPWTSWELDMHGLSGSTTYHVVVRATDEHGRRDHQVGSFTTPETPDVPVRISIDRIDMKDNGDLIGDGEVRFGFVYDGALVGTRSEQKLSDSATVWVDAYNFVFVDLGPDETTKSFALWGGERDVAITGFCEAPVPGLACHGINWNVAFSGHLTLAEIAGLPTCDNYGFEGAAAADRCEQISDAGGIGDEPRYDAVVRYRVG